MRLEIFPGKEPSHIFHFTKSESILMTVIFRSKIEQLKELGLEGQVDFRDIDIASRKTNKHLRIKTSDPVFVADAIAKFCGRQSAKISEGELSDENFTNNDSWEEPYSTILGALSLSESLAAELISAEVLIYLKNL